MASYLISNHEVSSNQSRELKRKKRSRNETHNKSIKQESIELNNSRWKSEAEQRIYSTKLIDALRSRSIQSSQSSPSPTTGRAVRDTAYKVLASTAKGKTRWSRAILTDRLRTNMQKHKKAKKITAMKNVTSGDRLKKKQQKSVLEKKVHALGKLVPGCKKVPLPNLLEETTDYIAALQMQIRVMATITNLLSGAGQDLS